MAGSVENGRQSRSDLCASHLCIHYGAAVVTSGSHTLSDAYSCKHLRHRPAIQCVLQDSVSGCRNFDWHVRADHFPLVDLVWRSLSKRLWLRRRYSHESECPLMALSGHWCLRCTCLLSEGKQT